MRHIELGQEGDSYAEIERSLFLGQTANRWQRQANFFHGNGLYSPLEARR